MNEIIWILLCNIFPQKSSRLYELYNKFKSGENIYTNIKENAVPNLTEFEINALHKKENMKYAEDICNFCRQNNIKIITADSEEYPYLLRTIQDPPLVLYCFGDTSCLNLPAVGIVGTRRPNSYSLKCADYFSHEIAKTKTTVISGFAKGIDTASHMGAINAGGKTIAVLGCGILNDYPSGTMKFKEKIAENGCVVSEYPPLAVPRSENFKIRNRIISGLSHGVLIVEAAKRSGSINTAAHAIDQGKEVYVIPPQNIFDKRYEGQILLLKDGAVPVYSPEMIINDITNFL